MKFFPADDGYELSALSFRGKSAFRKLLKSGNSSAIFIRGAGGTLGIQIIGAAMLFVSQVVLARLLGIESYGTYVFAIAWVNVLLLVARQGFDLATVRFISDYKNRNQWRLLKGYLLFSQRAVCLSSIVVAIVMALTAWVFRAHIGTEGLRALWLAAAALPFLAFNQILQATIRGLGFVVRPQILVTILHPFLLLVAFSTAIIWWGFEPTAYMGMTAYLAATVTILAGLWIMLHKLIPGPVRDAAPMTDQHNWFKTSIAMMFLMSFGPTLNQLSIIILGSLDGDTAAGQYGAAVRIANIVHLLIMAQNSALGPMVAKLYSDDNQDRLQKITNLGVRLVTIASLAVVATVVFFGHWILGIMGEEFQFAYPVLVVLVCGNFLFAFAGPASMLLNMTGLHALSAKMLAVSAGFNIVMALVLIPIYGAFGAAVATALTMVLCGGLMARATWRHLQILTVFTLPWRR